MVAESKSGEEKVRELPIGPPHYGLDNSLADNGPKFCTDAYYPLLHRGGIAKVCVLRVAPAGT